MSRKKKTPHVQMTADAARVGYRNVMMPLFTPEQLRPHHQEVMKLRSTLEVLSMDGSGQMSIVASVKLLVQLNTWVAASLIDGLPDMCGHKDCMDARREGFLNAIADIASHLVNNGDATEAEEGVTH